MKATIEAVSKKDKRIGIKVGEEWYGAWLQTKDGKPTDLAWLGTLQKGASFEFEFDTDDRGYHNITSAKRVVTSVANGDGRNSVALNCATAIVVALINNGKLEATSVPETLATIADAGDRWLHG